MGILCYFSFFDGSCQLSVHVFLCVFAVCKMPRLTHLVDHQSVVNALDSINCNDSDIESLDDSDEDDDFSVPANNEVSKILI